MALKKKIAKISLASVFSALSVVFILLGSILEVLDLTVAALCALIIHISIFEIKDKYPLLIYFSSSVLSIILCPFTSAMLYYVFFFGYYPILKVKLKRLGKFNAKIICTVIFNAVFILLMLLFKTVFALQNEPFFMYIILLAVYNVFFICFDRCIDVLLYVYVKRIRPKLPIGRI